MKSKHRKFLRFVGKPVFIEWKNIDNDWPTFFVEDVSVSGSQIKLRGIDTPEGYKHVGDIFWCSVQDIKSIRIMNIEK